MKALASIAVLSLASSGAHAFEAWMSNKDCPKGSILGWCSAQASAEGWKLKYQSKSPPDLMDGEWLYEVWTKDKAAAVCMYSGGRGGVRINHCRTLQEVTAQ